MSVLCKWALIKIKWHNTKNQRVAHQYITTSSFTALFKEQILKIVKVPKPMRMVWGSLAAYWLAGIINPAFVAIAAMIALFIPILIVDPLFPSRPES